MTFRSGAECAGADYSLAGLENTRRPFCDESISPVQLGQGGWDEMRVVREGGQVPYLTPYSQRHPCPIPARRGRNGSCRNRSDTLMYVHPVRNRPDVIHRRRGYSVALDSAADIFCMLEGFME